MFRFFFSYSWKNRGQPLQRFFKDLAEQVRKSVGGSIDDVAFRDRVSMEAGTSWPKGLLDAMQASQVLVYLISIDYIQSDYCGKELQVFLERIEQFRAANPGAAAPRFLQPVIWVPPIGTLPKPLDAIQPEDEQYPADYASRGLESLSKRRDKTAYNAFVETLALRIVKAAAGNPLPRLDKYQSIDEIRNAFLAEEPVPPQPVAPQPVFEEEQETRVRCVYIVPRESDAQELQRISITGKDGASRPLRTETSCYSRLGAWHWQPYKPPVAVKIFSLVQQQVTEFPYDPVEIDADTPASFDRVVEQLRVLAQSDQIVLLIVDAWATYLERYQTFLEKFDLAVSLNYAVVVPWNEDDPDTKEQASELETRLRVYLKTKYIGNQPLPFLKPRIRTIDEFQNTVPDLLRTIRMNIDTYRAQKRQVIESSRTAPQVRSARDGRQ